MKKIKKIKKTKKTRMAVANTASQKQYKQSRIKALMPKVFGIILVLAFGLIFVFVSGVFDVTKIIVQGNKNVSDEQVVSFSGIQQGTNIFAVSKKNIVAKLHENAYLNGAEIKRVLPDKIEIIVDERNVQYLLELGNSYVYIDGQGIVLEISNVKLDVPIIIGWTTDLSSIKPNDRLNDDDLRKMNVLSKIIDVATHNDMLNLITRIDVSDEMNYTLYLDGESKIAYLGNGDELNTRFLYIKSILKEQKGKIGEIFVNVDLNKEYVYFRENI